jgi:2-(1,2-epoxy-1,2-dihydrophenyl)acetyl-CoA isomerase
MTDTLLLNQDGPIATLRFNRPAQMNSLNDAMAHDLLETVRAVSQSEQVRVLILQGAGKQFMAGGDVGFFYQSLNNLADCVGPLIDQVHQTIMLLRTMPQIVLACVHGAAAGFGMS